MSILLVDEILNSIVNTLIMIGIHINSMIYDLVSFLFEIFISIASARLFDNEMYDKIANSIYLVVGVVALFIISYAFLRAIIDPDGAAKGNTSPRKLVTNVMISVALLAFVPTIFDAAFRIQDVVVSTGVIQNIILGRRISDESEDSSNIKEAGRQMANDVFVSFFTPVNTDPNNPVTTEAGLLNHWSHVTVTNCWLLICTDGAYSMRDAYVQVNKGQQSFAVYSEFAEHMHGGTEEQHLLDWNFLLQLISGCLLVWVMANFCIDIAVRSVKLAYFQIIAPLPIFSLLLPGQNKVFNNWMKNSISTYADIFVRLALIFFGIVLITNLPSLGDWSSSHLDISTGHPGWAKAFIIIGILIFLKQAPKLISDIFGLSTGSFKLGIKDKLGEMALVGDKAKELTSRAQGAVSGALGAGWTSRRNNMGWMEGLKYGATSGWKHGNSNPHQFGAGRQGFYTDIMDGEGKAGWFGRRAFMDKTAAKWTADAKNKYKEENFRRVLEYQQDGGAWRDLYDRRMKAKKDEFETNRGNIEIEANAQMKAEQARIDQLIVDLDDEYSAAVAKKANYESELEIYNNNKAAFDKRKSEELSLLNAEYEKAVKAKDLNKQLDLQYKMEEIGKRTYRDEAAEAKLAQLKSSVPDLEALENKRRELVNQRNNVQMADEYVQQLNSIAEEEARLDEEYAYMIRENRDYKSDLEFYKKHGGFSDFLRGVNAEFENGVEGELDAHPDFKDVNKTHMKYLTREEVTSYMGSAEGQKAISVMAAAQKINSQGGGDKKDDKK